MKRAALALLLLLACGAGCFRPFELAEDARWDGRDHRPPPAPPTVPPITAEQVTTQNAHKLSQALLEEMDREANQDAVSTPRSSARK